MNAGVYFGQLVIGPAGSGKSTYSKVMQQMAETLKRRIIIFNLDPAAEYNQYTCDIDIQQLITLQDAMDQMELGPNGGLLFCIQYLLQNQEWLNQQLSIVGQDDYVIFDCPGQIELYSDQSVFREFVQFLQNYGFSLVSMFMMDVNFISEQNKFLSGVLQALSTQIALQLPAITVLTKTDLLQNQSKLQRYLQYFSGESEYHLPMTGQQSQSKKQEDSLKYRLFHGIHQILNANDVTSIRSLNVSDEDSVRDLLLQADNAIQYGQNLQPDDRMYDKADEQMINNLNSMNLEDHFNA